jgi:tetratricopeptide (TPR) repeat protein
LKRLVLVFLVYIVSLPALYAQCLKIDSLRLLLALPNLSDTARINTLNVLGQEFLLNKQYFYASNTALQAYQLAQAKNYKIGMGDALLTTGKVNYQSDDVRKRDTECIPNYNKALELFTEVKANDRIAIAYRTLAEYYNNMSYQQSEYEQQALDSYLLYLQAAEKSGDKVSLAEAYETVGYLYEKLGNDKKT